MSAQRGKPAWSPLTRNLLNDKVELVNIMTQGHKISRAFQEDYQNANQLQRFLYLPDICLLRLYFLQKWCLALDYNNMMVNVI